MGIGKVAMGAASQCCHLVPLDLPLNGASRVVLLVYPGYRPFPLNVQYNGINDFDF